MRRRTVAKPGTESSSLSGHAAQPANHEQSLCLAEKEAKRHLEQVPHSCMHATSAESREALALALSDQPPLWPAAQSLGTFSSVYAQKPRRAMPGVVGVRSLIGMLFFSTLLDSE
jgi:hypothetical protein